ncbi:DUF2116 family Zn-ribbon domain-containing protein [Candidatus Saccharibacteria bacterium]|nr:DUF2116 family Zn-ribbon domain-containing protein [Candidatus Saccharibacteria bacterium]
MKNNTQNVNQLTIIANLRAENYSYASIAKQLGMSPNTVKSICLRKGILTPDKPRKTKTEKAALQICKQCGKPIDNSWNRIGKSFCSDKCRTSFWNAQKKERKERQKASFVPAQISLEKGPDSAGLPAAPELSWDS